jgi:hypothetical protein
MSGLDGFPFTGLTGMGAFAHHVPDDGAVIIYYGPHIGITKSGTIGEIHRIGQHKNSGCCGAVKVATDKLLKNQIILGNVTELDYQMNVIEQILLKQKDKIANSKNPIYEATEVIYEAIDERIVELVQKTIYPCKYVILIGAILINSDSDMGSFTSARRGTLINQSNGEHADIMTNLIDNVATNRTVI